MENEDLENRVIYLPLLKEKKDTERCPWKKVAETDEYKLAEGNKNITLGKNKECYKCDGYNRNCKPYQQFLKI